MNMPICANIRPGDTLNSARVRMSGDRRRRPGSARQDSVWLGLPARPVPPRGGLVHRPAQARGVGLLGCEHLPAREGGLDLLLRCAFDPPPPPTPAEAQ